jgi:hypothetical protein
MSLQSSRRHSITGIVAAIEAAVSAHDLSCLTSHNPPSAPLKVLPAGCPFHTEAYLDTVPANLYHCLSGVDFTNLVGVDFTNFVGFDFTNQGGSLSVLQRDAKEKRRKGEFSTSAFAQLWHQPTCPVTSRFGGCRIQGRDNDHAIHCTGLSETRCRWHEH